jgi:hypothetical protein
MKYSYCSRCEKEGYFHRGICDSEGQLAKANDLERARMFRDNAKGFSDA